MSEFGNGRLWQLLPEIHRIRDVEAGSPLRALLGVIETQVSAVEQDIDRLYQNWFIETCEEWVVPYVGDLLAVRGLQPIAAAGFSQRPYVANTLRYRRRKGTRAVLEQLANDAAGWPAVAVEFFQLLSTTQHLSHLRPGNLRTPDLRDAGALELLGGPFESASRTAEVRPGSRGGKYNLPGVGIFLFRLEPFAAANTVAAPASALEGAAGLFRFSPLGRDLPLFNRRRTAVDEGETPRESTLPGPLRRRAIYDDLETLRQAIAAGRAPEPAYFDAEPVLELAIAGAPVPAAEIVCCDLSDWKRPPATLSYPGPDGAAVDLPIRAAVDPVLGRISFRTADAPPQLLCSYSAGFSARIGGGPYERESTLTALAGRKLYPVSGGGAALTDALASWSVDEPPGAVLEISDSLDYAITDFAVPLGLSLEIRAADGERPLLRAADPVVPWTIDLGDRTSLAFDGLLLAAGVQLTVDGQASCALRDTTLLPGRSLRLGGAPVLPDAVSLALTLASGQANISLERTICGRIALPLDRDAVTLTAADCIIDGAGGAPPALTAGDVSLQRTTVFGATTAEQFSLASDCLFTGQVQTALTQAGCIRFSAAPDGSRLPKRFHCQPDLALAAAPAAERAATLTRLDPCFTSERYGDPGYAQLTAATAPELRTGASDGSEMGAFQLLHQPQRAANLAAGIDEYLRYGLEAAFFYVT
ncbi:MAG TPA: hypothetical protein VH083_09135 [Myxococcales bacterium]|jgi:hypothetical protein|nr:hypothetical protein [Myxococcales bacterium]